MAEPVWWNLDVFLAEQIARNLRDYVAKSAGSPGQYTEEQWKTKLSSIATRLEAYQTHKSMSLEQGQFITKSAQDALHELAEVFPGLWD